MNQELALKVVSYIADYLGNLPDDSKSGFENYSSKSVFRLLSKEKGNRMRSLFWHGLTGLLDFRAFFNV